MPKTIPLEPAAEWVELSSTDEDWDELSPQLLKTMLVQLYLVRAFEEEVLDLARVSSTAPRTRVLARRAARSARACRCGPRTR